ERDCNSHVEWPQVVALAREHRRYAGKAGKQDDHIDVEPRQGVHPVVETGGLDETAEEAIGAAENIEAGKELIAPDRALERRNKAARCCADFVASGRGHGIACRFCVCPRSKVSKPGASANLAPSSTVIFWTGRGLIRSRPPQSRNCAPSGWSL